MTTLEYILLFATLLLAVGLFFAGLLVRRRYWMSLIGRAGIFAALMWLVFSLLGLTMSIISDNFDALWFMTLFGIPLALVLALASLLNEVWVLKIIERKIREKDKAVAMGKHQNAAVNQWFLDRVLGNERKIKEYQKRGFYQHSALTRDSLPLDEPD